MLSLPSPARAVAARIAAVALGLALSAGGLAGCDDGPDTCLPDCTATRDYDAIAYDLRASLDWDERRLIAEEDITVVVAPGAAPVIELDARVTVERVTAGGTELGFAHDSMTSTLWVDLGPIADRGGELTFTVAYRAAGSAALVFAGPRDDDPVRARVAYSNSEPDRGRYWLISNDHPSDRARFSIELEVDAGEDVIANGERRDDREDGGRRTVRYAIDQPLPTYMMAFAAGELEHTERLDGRVPLALWYRRGAVVDPAAHLAINARHMARFESLLGPYPFARYTTVLLPGFPGGMENATITFNSESSGQGAISETLNAHELGHHWFGDWVTMHDYRDVWIKEGMATLLGAEASRPLRDGAARGRLFGASFSFYAGDAVIDDELTGLSRYTSGPYERSAWMLTQVRARIGEDAFWGALRGVLETHALGTIDTEAFVRAFAPALDGAAIEQWLAVLDDKGAPRIRAASTPDGIALTLTDDQGFLLDPIGVDLIDTYGAASAYSLAPGAPLALTVQSGGYVAPDQRDVHPSWYISFDFPEADQSALLGLSFPISSGALATFEARSAGTQERVLSTTGLPSLEPTDLQPTYDALDSTLARRGLVTSTCVALAGLPDGDPEIPVWAASLAPLLAAPAQPGYTIAYAPCARALSATGLPAELAALTARGAALAPADLARLDYLLGFDYGAAGSLATIGRLATSAPSLRHRELALDRLIAQTRAPYAGVSAADLPAYRAFFRARLADVTSASRLLLVWRGIVAVRAGEALPEVAAALHDVPLDPSLQTRIVCEAFDLATPTQWAGFQTAAEPWSELSAAAAEALEDPSACDDR